MPAARFKDLVIDAGDVELLGRFWAAALGLAYVPHDDGDAHLAGPTRQSTVWVNRVPEPKSVKHRVHLDVHTGGVDQLEALGATVVEALPRWTVMADPEGGEFCAFVRERPPDQRLYEVVVDAASPERQARWWADLLGARLGHEAERDFWWVDEIDGAPFESLVFNPVPEPKTAKNRIHPDVTVPDLATVLDAGAVLVRRRDDEIDWHVLADPEGNEFCAFVDTSAGDVSRDAR